MGIVFAKTPKGHQEITSKAGGLTPRVRRVLIFVDGKRTVDELRGMVQADDLQITLGLLEEQGFIEMASIKDPSGAMTPAPAEPQPSIGSFRPIPDPPSRKEMDMARNFIQNSLKTFCGPFAHLEIVEAALPRIPMRSCAGSSTPGSTRSCRPAKASAAPKNCAPSC